MKTRCGVVSLAGASLSCLGYGDGASWPVSESVGSSMASHMQVHFRGVQLGRRAEDMAFSHSKRGAAGMQDHPTILQDAVWP
jgi:hypothetical protein